MTSTSPAAVNDAQPREWTVPPKASTKKPDRLDSLTAIRALAALAVFAHHSHSAIWPSSAFGRLSVQGSAGVAFFFVLSGFVLTWSSRPGDTTRAFYRRRLARIAPLYLLAWLGGVALNLDTGESPFRNQLPALLGVQAWIPSGHVYFAGNAVLWSLSCEAFFYLLFPHLIGPIRRLSTRAVALTLAGTLTVSIGWPVLLHPAGPSGISYWLMYLFPPARFLEFLAGVLLAVLVQRRAVPRIPLIPVIVLSIASYLATGWAPLYLQPVALMLLPWALVIVAAAQHDLAGGTPAPAWLVRLGAWSFAFYLFHQLVIKEVAHRLPPSGTVGQVGWTAALLAAAVLISGVLYEKVERPLERRLRGRQPLPTP